MTRLALRRLGLLAALLALTAQLAWGATVPDPALAKIGFGVICHSGQDGQPPAAPPPAAPPPAAPTHHAPDCLLCPLCLAHAMPVPMPASPPPLSVPRVAEGPAAMRLPPAIAMPAARPVAAQPRGPPFLA